MTATRSSRNKPVVVTPGYVLYSIKRAWAIALLIFIALFFFMSVSTMMELDSVAEYFERYRSNNDIYDSLQSYLTPDEEIYAVIENDVTRHFNELIAYSAVITVCAALFAGCYTLSFLHNKVSAGFFHSLPERRGGHFVAALTASFTVYFVPLLVNTLILSLVFMVRGYFFGYVFSLIAQLFIYSVFYYVVFLAIVFLAGVLTGSTAIHALFACYIPAVLPVLFLSLTLLLEIGVTYLRCDPFDWLGIVGGYMTPIARMIIVLDAIRATDISIPVFYLILDVVITALLFWSAYRIYEKRPVERAGTPIIYKPVGEAVKYSIMLPAAILMGMLFNDLGAGFFWFVFGSLAGALLSLMLMNTILARSAKAMFTHMKGFGIFCGAAVAVYVIFTTGIFGYADYHVPALGKITVIIDGSEEYVLKGEEAKAFRSYMKEINRGIRSGEISNNVSYLDFDTVTVYGEDMIPKEQPIESEMNEFIAKSDELERRVNVQVNYSEYMLRYYYRNFTYSDFADIIALVASSESYKDRVTADGATLNNLYINTFCPAEVIDELGLFEEYKKFDQDLMENVGSKGYRLWINFNIYSGNDTNALLESKEYEELNRKFTEFLRNRSGVLTTEPSVGSFSYELDTAGTNNNYSRGVDIYANYWGNSPLYASDIKALLSILDTVNLPIDISIEDIYSGQSYSINSEGMYSSVYGDMKAALSECTVEDYIEDRVNTLAYAVIVDHGKGEVIKVESKAMLRELLYASSVINTSAMISSFAATDSDYSILYVDGNEMLWEAFPAYLFIDRVPEFLK